MLSRLGLSNRTSQDEGFSTPCALWSVDLKLTHVDCNPGTTLVHFQGQYLTIFELDYNILQAEIQNTEKTRKEMEVGEFCLVEDGPSDRWYRGRIQNKQTAMFDVFLLDHGNVLSVAGSRLASGSDELFVLPPKIVCGFFANVLPVRECWDGASEKYFSSLIGSNVKGYIQALLPHKVLILEAPDVNKDLKRMGCGKHVDTDTFLLLVEMLTDVPLKQSSAPVPDLLIGKPNGQEYSFKPHSLQGFEDVLSFCGPKLTAGKKVKVKVTAAVSPGTFFLQTMSAEKDLHVMSEKLAVLCESKSKDSKTMSMGNMGLLCSVRGKDEQWCRGYVKFLPVNSQVRVLFVDYGFCESVKVENMLQLPPSFLFKPIMAFPCALSCLAGQDGVVKTHQLSLLKEGLLGGVLEAQIDSFDVERNLYSVTLLSAGDNPVTLADSFQDDTEPRKSELYLESEPRKNEWDPKSEPMSPQNGYLYSESRVMQVLIQAMADSLQAEEIEDSAFEGYLEYVLNPSQFWLRSQKRNRDFEEMMNSITEHFRQIQLDEEILESPEPGEFCCAMYESDMHYYRAIVTDTLEHGAEVFFVDFGNTEKVPHMLIKKMPQKFAGEPAFALRCSLVNVVPVDDDLWTTTATAYFKQAASNKALQVKVVHIRRDGLVVNLYKTGAQNNKSISELLTGANQAVYWKYTPSEPAIPGVISQKRNGKPKFCNKKKPVPRNEFNASVPAKNHVSVATEEWEFCEKNTEVTKAETANDVAPSKVFNLLRFLPGSELAVRCSHVNSPSDFWCQLHSKIPALDKLMDELQQYYQTHTCPLQSGDRCCVTKFPGDGRWYRATIIGAQKDEIEVILVDYGITMREKGQNMQAIMPEHLELEGQSFRCSLYNLIDPVDLNRDKWSAEACDLLKDFVQDHSVSLTCNIISHQYVKNKGLCCAVDLHNSSHHSVAKKLVEKGLAREVKTSVQLSPSVSLQSFAYCSFNLTSGSEEQVYVTHMCSPWEMFCQLDRNTDIIEDLAEKTSNESKKMVNGAVVGKLCLAKYSDGKWYRGKIMPVPPSTLHLNVFFVDYGNTHIVEKSNVMSIPRESTDLLFTPMQALRCCLADIHEQENFAEVHQSLEKSILNVPLRAVVVGKTEEGTVMINLFDGDIHINDKVRKLIDSQVPKPPKPEVMSPDTDSTLKTPKHANQKQKTLKKLNTPTNRAVSLKCPTQKKQPSKPAKSTVPKPSSSGILQTNQKKESKGNTSVKFVESTGKDHVNLPSKQSVCALVKLSDLPDNNITAGFRGLGFVSHVDKVSSFFVQMHADEPSILKMVEDLNSELLKEVVERNAAVELKRDDLVAAEYEEDGALYRAVVKDVESSGQYRMEFVDYGNTAVVRKEKTYLLTRACLSQPRLSIPCSLVDASTYDSDVMFTDAVMGKPLMIEFLRRFGVQWEVNVKIQGQEDNPVSAMLPEAECSVVAENEGACAVVTNENKPPRQQSTTSVIKDKQTSNTESETVMFTARGEKETSGDSPKSSSPPSETSPEPSVIPKKHVAIPPQKIRAGQTENGKLLSVLENGDLYVRVNRNSGELAELENLISAKRSKCQITAEEDVKEGLECLSWSSKDQQWHRAMVQHVSTDRRRCRVFLMDHGSTEDASLGGIRMLCDELRQTPMQAVLCKWTGPGVPMGEETYEIWKEILRPLLGKDLKLMFVSYSESDNLWTVEIMMNELFLVQQLKPATRLHAVGKTPVSTPIDTETVSEKDSASESSPHQNEPFHIHQRKPATGWHVGEKTPVSSKIDTETASERDSGGSPPQKLFPAPVNMDQVYSGFAAGVTTPSDFYIALEELLLTRNTVSTIVEGLPDDLPPLPEAHLTPGSCCLVWSGTEHEWCRAEVMHVDRAALVVINLVDYGHCEKVPYRQRAELRRLPEQLTWLPKETYPCVLRGVEPARAGQWTDEAVAFFRECVCQRNLRVLFKQYVSEARWEVDLVADGVHVAQELVNAGHASYVDLMFGCILHRSLTERRPALCPALPESTTSTAADPKETSMRTNGRPSTLDGGTSDAEGTLSVLQSHTTLEILDDDRAESPPGSTFGAEQCGLM